MDAFYRSLLSTILCVGGPLILWLVFKLRPDLFVGKLKQVKWITSFFMALMFLTLAGNFMIDRRQPPNPARAVPPPPIIKETTAVTATPSQSEQEGRATVRRFFEIEDKK